MTEDPGLRGRASGLTDRRAECAVLDRVINAVRAGGSRVLVVRGEPGVGKSALLDYLAGRAAGCRVVRAAGVESEMELAFAGLHQLLAPVLDRADRLPVPQRDALRTAFGLSAGPVPDRFLVGLAALGLLSEGVGEGAGVRGAGAGSGASRPGLRDPGAGPGAGRAAGTRGRGPAGGGCAGAAGFGAD